MYSSTIKPNHQDLMGEGKQWSGGIGAFETVQAGIIPCRKSGTNGTDAVSSNCWAICFTADWVVVVMCAGDSQMPLSYVAANRAENIGMSVLQYVDVQGAADTMDEHLNSYLAPDGILAMDVIKLAKDEIQKMASISESRFKGAFHGELYNLHKTGLSMAIGVVCIDRASRDAVLWKCGNIDILYKYGVDYLLQAAFEEDSTVWSSKTGLTASAQLLKCEGVAQISMRSAGARDMACAISETSLPDSEFQLIRTEEDAAWVTWYATSAPEELVEITSQQFEHGREFTESIRLAEESGHGFFYLGNKFFSIENIESIFSEGAVASETMGLCLANCSLIDDGCIALLSNLRYVRYLDLRHTNITPACLTYLQKFKNLTFLDLTETQIRASHLSGLDFPEGMRLRIDI